MDDDIDKDLDDEELEALRLAALATLKPRNNVQVSTVSTLPINRIVTAKSNVSENDSSHIPFVQSDRKNYNSYPWRKHNQQPRRRGGMFPKSSQRSNLIVINPISLDDEKNPSEKSTLLQRICPSGNEDSMSPKTLRRTGPTRFNRHDSDSESSESDYDNSDSDSGSNETVLQDEPNEHFPRISSDNADNAPEKTELQRRLSFQSIESDLKSDTLEKVETTSVYNCLKNSKPFSFPVSRSEGYSATPNQGDRIPWNHSSSNNYSSYSSYESSQSYTSNIMESRIGRGAYDFSDRNQFKEGGNFNSTMWHPSGQIENSYFTKVAPVVQENQPLLSDVKVNYSNEIPLYTQTHQSDWQCKDKPENRSSYYSTDSYSGDARTQFQNKKTYPNNSLSVNDLRFELKKRIQHYNSPSVDQDAPRRNFEDRDAKDKVWDPSKSRQDRNRFDHNSNLDRRRDDYSPIRNRYDHDFSKSKSEYSSNHEKDRREHSPIYDKSRYERASSEDKTRKTAHEKTDTKDTKKHSGSAYDRNSSLERKKSRISQDRNSRERSSSKERNPLDNNIKDKRRYDSSPDHSRPERYSSQERRRRYSESPDRSSHERSISSDRSIRSRRQKRDRSFSRDRSRRNYSSSPERSRRGRSSSYDRKKRDRSSSRERKKYNSSRGKLKRDRSSSGEKSRRDRSMSQEKRKCGRSASQEKSRCDRSISQEISRRDRSVSQEKSRRDRSSSQEKGRRDRSTSQEKSRRDRSVSQEKSRRDRSSSRGRGRYERSSSRDRTKYGRSSSRKSRHERSCTPEKIKYGLNQKKNKYDYNSDHSSTRHKYSSKHNSNQSQSRYEQAYSSEKCRQTRSTSRERNHSDYNKTEPNSNQDKLKHDSAQHDDGHKEIKSEQCDGDPIKPESKDKIPLKTGKCDSLSPDKTKLKQNLNDEKTSLDLLSNKIERSSVKIKTKIEFPSDKIEEKPIFPSESNSKKWTNERKRFDLEHKSTHDLSKPERVNMPKGIRETWLQNKDRQKISMSFTNRRDSLKDNYEKLQVVRNKESSVKSGDKSITFEKDTSYNRSRRRSRSRSRSSYSRSSSSSSSSSQPALRSVSSVIKPVLGKSLEKDIKAKNSQLFVSQFERGSPPKKGKDDFHKSKGGREESDSKKDALDGKRMPVHMRLGSTPLKRVIQMNKDVEAAFVNSSSGSDSENYVSKNKRQNIRIISDVGKVDTDCGKSSSKRLIESQSSSESKRLKTYR